LIGCGFDLEEGTDGFVVMDAFDPLAEEFRNGKDADAAYVARADGDAVGGDEFLDLRGLQPLEGEIGKHGM
jgi:hypothetical protein